MGIRLAPRARSGIRRRDQLLVVEGFGAAALDTTKWQVPSWVVDQPAFVGGRVRCWTTLGYTQIETVRFYPLVGRDAVAEVTALPPAVQDTETYLGLTLTGPPGPDSTSPSAQWDLSGTSGRTLFAMAYLPATGPVVQGSVAYDAVAHRWWRVRESGGTIFWETSPDGAAWTTQVSWASPYAAPTASQVYMGSGYFGADPGAGSFAEFDNVRVGTPDLAL